jgi:hypothetical protein
LLKDGVAVELDGETFIFGSINSIFSVHRSKKLEPDQSIPNAKPKAARLK